VTDTNRFVPGLTDISITHSYSHTLKITVDSGNRWPDGGKLLAFDDPRQE